MQMLLVMAAGASLYSDIQMDGASSKPSHAMSRRWIEAAESWLLTPSSPPPESWPALATQCLLVIAKRANLVKKALSGRRQVRQSGGPWQVAIIKEAPPNVRLSQFHREMRRRLWVTILELDLQASFERGMPPSIKPGDFNAHQPLHIDDNEIQESTTELPSEQPLSTWTRTSFQVLLQRSFSTRLEVCSLVNRSRDQADFEQVIRLAEELTQALADIPAWTVSAADPRDH